MALPVRFVLSKARTNYRKGQYKNRYLHCYFNFCTRNGNIFRFQNLNSEKQKISRQRKAMPFSALKSDASKGAAVNKIKKLRKIISHEKYNIRSVFTISCKKSGLLQYAQ